MLAITLVQWKSARNRVWYFRWTTGAQNGLNGFCLCASASPSAPVYPRLQLCVLGDAERLHRQKANVWAIHLELLHLPEQVFLLWSRRDSAHVLFIFSLTRGVRTTLQTPDTNNTVMVRGRSSRTLIVCAGLWPFISVYCKHFFFPSFVLSRCILENSCALV